MWPSGWSVATNVWINGYWENKNQPPHPVRPELVEGSPYNGTVKQVCAGLYQGLAVSGIGAEDD